MQTSVTREKGFTLLELLVVLAIGSILLSVGVPSFRDVIMDNRMSDQANAFVVSVNAARSSAVRFQREATICPTAGFDDAVPSCDAGADWTDGWIVWVDKNRDAATSANEIVSVQEPLDDTLTITTLTAESITYDARGFSVAGGDELLLCDNRAGEEGRLIRINGVGRTKVTRQVCL